MIYRDFQNIKLSALGYGAMRLPVIDGNENEIDEKLASELIGYAYENGVNYFDTAWGYHGGNSETVIGKALKNYPRESFYLATKFPGYDVRNFGKCSEIFEQQLQKLQVDYFDFYLFHNVCERNIEKYLDRSYGTFDYLVEQKKNGRIKRLGFSAHGDCTVMRRFLEAYGSEMEFCQLQINYIDWTLQKAKEKVELLNEWNIPVWVMEPVRGGKLAKLSDENSAVLKALRPDESDAAWAFRFIQSVPEAVVCLSGMTDMEQVKENIKIFSEDKPLNDGEMKALSAVAGKMLNTVPCTACRYCTEYCPMELDIPKLISFYNEHKFSGGGFLAPMYIASLPEEKRPASCVGCRSCEAVCPQQIKISEILADFAETVK